MSDLQQLKNDLLAGIVSEKEHADIMEDPKTDELTFKKATRERFKDVKRVVLRCLHIITELSVKLTATNDALAIIERDHASLVELLEENGIAMTTQNLTELRTDWPPVYQQSLPQDRADNTISGPAGNISYLGVKDERIIRACEKCLWSRPCLDRKKQLKGQTCDLKGSAYYGYMNPTGAVRRCADWEEYKEVEQSEYSRIAGYDFSDGVS